MTTSVISFNESCIDLPSSAVSVHMSPMVLGYSIKVEIDGFAKYGFPDAAEVAIEVFHPMMPGNQPSTSLGRVGLYPDKLSRESHFPGIPTSKGTEVRLVVRDPSGPSYLARTERMRATSDEYEGEGGGSGGSSNSIISVRESHDMEVPWMAIMDAERPTILVNPNYLSRSEVKNPQVFALLLPAAIQLWMHGICDNEEAYNTHAWRIFRDRAVRYMEADSWAECLSQFDNNALAAQAAAEGYWTQGCLGYHTHAALKKNAAFLED